MRKANGVNYSKRADAVKRRLKSAKRLEAQIASNSKVSKDGKTRIILIPSDIIRINKELSVLKARI